MNIGILSLKLKSEQVKKSFKDLKDKIIVQPREKVYLENAKQESEPDKCIVVEKPNLAGLKPPELKNCYKFAQDGLLAPEKLWKAAVDQLLPLLELAES